MNSKKPNPQKEKIQKLIEEELEATGKEFEIIEEEASDLFKDIDQKS